MKIRTRYAIILLSLISPTLFAQKNNKRKLSPEDDYIKIIAQHLNKKQWQQAKKNLDIAMKEDPNNSDLRFLSGKYYYQIKKNDSARYQLNKALSFTPNNTDAKQLLINIETKDKRYSSAICYVNELLEVNPYERDLWLKKIHLYRLQGNDIEADRLLERIKNIHPKDSKTNKNYRYSLEERALQLRKKGQIEQANQVIEKLIANDPRNEDFYLEMINNYISMGNYDKALEYTNRGLGNLPNNHAIAKKKLGLLQEQKRYTEALDFIKTAKRKGINLEQNINELLLESARFQEQNDPYTLYGKVFERTGSSEALEYLLNQSISKGYYSDAIHYIGIAKKKQGETTKLLSKEYELYKRMGNNSKANQILSKLYKSNPGNSDLRDYYTQLQYSTGKDLMTDERYSDALPYLEFAAKNGDKEIKENANISLYNAYLKAGKFNDALTQIDKIINLNPRKTELYVKKASVLIKLDDYLGALELHRYAIENSIESDKERYINGYEDLALSYIKILLEDSYTTQALQVSGDLLELKPESKQGLKYAINAAMQLKQDDLALNFALSGTEKYPQDIYFKVKISEIYSKIKNYDEAYAIVKNEIEKFPTNPSLVGLYSELSQKKSISLSKEKQHQEALETLENALQYDAENKELLYHKGLAFEGLKKWDSAYHYQRNYEPATLEAREFKQHLNILKNKTYKNKIAIYHLRNKLGENQAISAISTMEYSRILDRNTFTARFSYSGRDQGAGYQPQLEWTHQPRPELFFIVNGAYATKYFPKLMANGSAYYTLRNGLEIQGGAGYRIFQDEQNTPDLISSFIGVGKDFEWMWANLKANLLYSDGFTYNIFGQARFYILDNKTYITAMASAGSAPEIEIIDRQLYQTTATFNSMVGLNGQYLFSDKLTIGLQGNWYNFKTTELRTTVYKSMFTLYLQLYISF